MKNLTEAQVDKFLGEKLKIPDWKSQLSASKVKFLTTLFQRYRAEVCYENLRWGARSEEELVPPSVEETIQLLTETLTGACLQLNYFMLLLLTSLSYEVHAIVDFPPGSTDHYTNHCLLVVRIPREELLGSSDLEEIGDEDDSLRFLMDVGNLWPIPEPISVNKLPYSFQLCKDFRMMFEFNEEKNCFQRSFIGGHPMKGPYESPDFKQQDFFLYQEPYSWEDLLGPMTITFTEISKTFFLNTTLLFRFLSLEDSEHYEYVLCIGRKIVVASPQRSRQLTQYENYVDMEADLIKYFPNVDSEMMSKALRNFDERRASGLRHSTDNEP